MQTWIITCGHVAAAVDMNVDPVDANPDLHAATNGDVDVDVKC